MSLVKEPKERVDYAYVINMQLNRIASIRSKMMQEQPESAFHDILKRNALWYLAHVEGLYAILLPELRGNARKYINIARKLVRIIDRIDALKKEKEDLERSQNDPFLRKPESVYRAKLVKIEEKYEELKAKRKALYNELPEEIRNLVENSVFMYEPVFYVVDAALEEMLVRLNEVGLLLSGKKVKVSVAGKKG